jgi:hypothetical protein
MSEWQRVCDKLPSEKQEVLVAYKDGLVYQGYWRKLNAILGEQEVEWMVYSLSGITEYPEPDYWMEIPPLPAIAP